MIRILKVLPFHIQKKFIYKQNTIQTKYNYKIQNTIQYKQKCLFLINSILVVPSFLQFNFFSSSYNKRKNKNREFGKTQIWKKYLWQTNYATYRIILNK